MTNNFQELRLLLAQTSQEFRRGLHKIIGAPSADSPAVLCDHLCFLRKGASGPDFDGGNYKQLVTDIADKVRLDWSSIIGLGSWADLPAADIEAGIVRRVDGDKIYGQDRSSHLPLAALDDAFSALSGNWRKLLAAIIYVHQVIRPSIQTAAAREDNSSWPSLAAAKKTGAEPLHFASRMLGPTLLDFWRWSASDLVSIATQPALAGYFVSCALGLQDGIRGESNTSDSRLQVGGLRVEVTSASYLQSWDQEEPAEIRFPLRSHRLQDRSTTVLSVNLQRRADIYVFCLLAHTDEKTLEPLDVSQWKFYVVQSSLLDAKFPLGKSIGLASLQAIGVLPVSYEDLAADIDQYVAPAIGQR